MGKKQVNFRNNYKFTETLLLNDATYSDYLMRFKRIALSIFEWVNLPKSMNAEWLEYCLYYNGMASLLKDEKFGFINTNCTSSGKLSIYGLPTQLNCYSFEYHTTRRVYTGLNPMISEERQKYLENTGCILVQNNIDRTPTCRFYGAFRI